MTMDDENEANEAVKELDGSKVSGERIRVEVQLAALLPYKVSALVSEYCQKRTREGVQGRRASARPAPTSQLQEQAC